MKKLNYLKFCIVLLIAVLSGLPSMAQTVTTNERKKQDNGYTYEFWSEKGAGTSSMTMGATGATFSTQWSGIKNVLARRGLGYETKDRLHWVIGYFTINYAANYTPTCNIAGSSSYLGVYGWAQDPTKPVGDINSLVEWYIIEAWCNWNPSKDGSAENFGTINVNGSNYDLIRTKRIDKPSIRNGDKDTFYQYFSIKQNSEKTGSISGSVNVSDHLTAWEKKGLKLSFLYEVSMLVEGYNENGNGAGSANFTTLNVTEKHPYVRLGDDSYTVKVGEGKLLSLDNYGFSGPHPDIKLGASIDGNVSVSGNMNKQYITGVKEGTSSIVLWGPDNIREEWDQAIVTVTPATGQNVVTPYEFKALGVKGDEKVRMLLDGIPTNSGHTLSTSFQTYKGVIPGKGQVSLEFVNDDGVTNGRDVRADYISMNGVKRETESMAVNGAVFQNGTCGGSYSEWLNCNGKVNYGATPSPTHPITIRARGNNGGEHIDLLINGQAVNGGWTLGTTFQEYSATVTGDGDIRVEYDNDGGLKDVVIDWVKVDTQTPRQAESMQYNTGFFANGRCGGGSYSEWMQCNGVIGFGKVSDNFNARLEVLPEPEAVVAENKKSGVRVYPNPSTGNVSVAFDATAVNANVKVYDTVGKVVYSKEAVTENEVQISNLPSGIYLVKVLNNGLYHKSKLLVH
jgi:hypothetical protein